MSLTTRVCWSYGAAAVRRLSVQTTSATTTSLMGTGRRVPRSNEQPALGVRLLELNVASTNLTEPAQLAHAFKQEGIVLEGT